MEALLVLAGLAGCGAAAEAAVGGWLLRARPAALLTVNYRRRRLLGRGGVTLAAPALGAAVLAGAWGLGRGPAGLQLYGAVAAVSLFGLLGWLDDNFGDSRARGVKGHFASLVKHGRVTTGLVKALGGALVGVWAAYMAGASGWALLPAGALVAASANVVNVLDVRPGRAIKGFAPAAALLLLLGAREPLHGTLPVLAGMLGGALAFARWDLREQMMLGDTGANALGCVLGLAAMALTAWPVQLLLAVALAAFCLVADRWSLTALIERTPALRWLDELGRPRPSRRGGHGG
jgi:UDP-N-acetylmuramyl pentapeptide phosphotransferase/UDP-N-acetylglucosamine-1-phosphate transferase